MKDSKYLLCVLTLTFLIIIPFKAQSIENQIVDSNIINAAPTKLFIDPLTIRPLFLIQVKKEKHLGTATGFVVQKGNNHYLVTNWHVISGRHPEINQISSPSGDTPDALLVWHHGKQLGAGLEKEKSCMMRKGWNTG
jgi:hypothetical protein